MVISTTTEPVASLGFIDLVRSSLIELVVSNPIIAIFTVLFSLLGILFVVLWQ